MQQDSRVQLSAIRHKQRIAKETAILSVVLTLLYLAAVRLNIIDHVHAFSQANEGWQIEEVALVGLFALAGVLTVSLRQLSFIRQEIVRKRAAEDRAQAMARRDALTGLPNRRKFNEAMAANITQARSGDGGFALMLVDLDRFKPVNDILGHAAGDIALCQVGERLTRLAGPGAFVARVGGDEFAVLMQNVTTREPLENMAARILVGFQQSFDIDGKPVRMGASLGVALLEGEHEDAESLFRRADMALFQAKKEGRNRFCLHSSELDDGARADALAEADLRRGLSESEFVPFFQPLVDLRSGRTVGMEVLARWNHPERGIINPGDFLPLAERLNVVAELTFQVFRKACVAALSFETEPFLAINISQSQLRDMWLPDHIIGVLNETGFSPRRIEIEITEDSLVEDVEVARSILYALKNHGMRVALDDFGTGYSSLVHLRDLPLDKIKIDRSFVTSLKSDIGSAKIVSAILGLGTSLGLPTVAEGVESEEVSRILADYGCIFGQGYHYSKPVPAEHVNEMLRLPMAKPANRKLA